MIFGVHFFLCINVVIIIIGIVCADSMEMYLKVLSFPISIHYILAKNILILLEFYFVF